MKGEKSLKGLRWPLKAFVSLDVCMHVDVQQLVERPARDAMRKEDLHSQSKLKDQVPEPAKDESPPETAHSSYRASLRGVSGVLDALWSSASSPPKGISPSYLILDDSSMRIYIQEQST